MMARGDIAQADFDPALARSFGLNDHRLRNLVSRVNFDAQNGVCNGGHIIIARHGEVILDHVFGAVSEPHSRSVRPDDIFPLLSITKSLTAICVLSFVERGLLRLNTRIGDVIPEFAVNGKENVTVAHLLSHTGGMPPQILDLPTSQLGNLESAAAYVCNLPRAGELGDLSYSAVSSHFILAEAVRRVDGGQRSFSDILAETVLDPLEMRDTSLGRRDDKADRTLPFSILDRTPDMFDASIMDRLEEALVDGAEIPGAGGYGSAHDILKFAEMLRLKGKGRDTQVISPAMLEMATRIHTGDQVFQNLSFACETKGWPLFPANFGLGFVVRGSNSFMPSQTGSLASPSTFGHKGAGLSNYWIDPVRDLVFVCLTTGYIPETESWLRWQCLSEMAISAVID